MPSLFCAVRYSKYPMSSQAEITAEITRRIVEGFHPQRIVLFGSRARGDARADSDYDVLIVAPSNESQRKRILPVYYALMGLQTHTGIDIVWWTPEEIVDWQGAQTHFINRVLRDGQVLYERSQ